LPGKPRENIDAQAWKKKTIGDSEPEKKQASNDRVPKKQHTMLKKRGD